MKIIIKSTSRKSNESVQEDNNQSERKTNDSISRFSESFLKERTVKNRKQIYLSVETFDVIQSYLKYISDVSFIAYVDNVLVQHIEEHKDTIRELFDKKVNPF